jgi:hypothetical protein
MDFHQPSSIIAITMPRELLGVRLRHQRRYHLLSLGNNPSNAFSNALRSGVRRYITLNSNCHRSRDTFTYRLIPKHWTLITTLLHIPRYIKHHCSLRKGVLNGHQKRRQRCSRCGMMAVCGKRSLLPSLAGVKGPSGCAVRQSSKSSTAIL